jgi:hypothetical protein
MFILLPEFEFTGLVRTLFYDFTEMSLKKVLIAVRDEKRKWLIDQKRSFLLQQFRRRKIRIHD